MRCDYTISIGNILQLAGGLVALAIAYVKLRERVIAIEVKLEPLLDAYNRRLGLRREDDREDA